MASQNDGTSDLRTLGYIAERDLDLMLVLDAHMGGPLTAHLLQQAGIAPDGPITASRSTPRNAGARETDVEVRWPGGALLIEDKIDAAFTDGQPASYRAELDTRRMRGEHVAAILICPRRYHARLTKEAGDAFDPVVTWEDLVEIAAAADDPLAQAAAVVMRAACAPSAGEDPSRSAWGDDYRSVVRDVRPNGTQVEPGPASLRTARAAVASYWSSKIDPPRVWKLEHRVVDGIVRTELDVTPVELGALPEGARLISKNRMQWVEIEVEKMGFDQPPSIQRTAVTQAVEAVLVLRQWASDTVCSRGYEE